MLGAKHAVARWVRWGLARVRPPVYERQVVVYKSDLLNAAQHPYAAHVFFNTFDDARKYVEPFSVA